MAHAFDVVVKVGRDGGFTASAVVVSDLRVGTKLKLVGEVTRERGDDWLDLRADIDSRLQLKGKPIMKVRGI